MRFSQYRLRSNGVVEGPKTIVRYQTQAVGMGGTPRARRQKMAARPGRETDVPVFVHALRLELLATVRSDSRSSHSSARRAAPESRSRNPRYCSAVTSPRVSPSQRLHETPSRPPILSTALATVRRTHRATDTGCECPIQQVNAARSPLRRVVLHGRGELLRHFRIDEPSTDLRYNLR